jgi:glutamate racemase
MSLIGVFDSGAGGKSVAAALQRAYPAHSIMFRHDAQHMPYGDKTPRQVLRFVIPILRQMERAGCDVIVIACNTVTTHHIAALRAQISVPLIGVEPMVKPAAAQTKTGIIAVCATPATLLSPRYAELKSRYAQNVTVLEPDCSRWAYMIEHDHVNEQLIAAQIEALCNAGADVLVLGCTHYHWIDQNIQRMAASRAVVMQPEAAIVSRVAQVLADRSLG